MVSRREVLEFPQSRVLLTKLRQAAHDDGADPRSFALLLGRAAASKPEAWVQEGYSTFAAYVLAPTPGGLGMTKEQVRTAAALAGAETAGLVERLLAREQKPERRQGRPRIGEEKGETFTFSERERGKADYVVARLKRDAESNPKAATLLGEVLSGETKPLGAAREMGWRKPRILLARQETVASAIVEHMSREAIQYIRDELDKHLKEN